MTRKEVEAVDAALRGGESLNQIAMRLGLTRQGLEYQIIRAGKRVTRSLYLEDARPADDRSENGSAKVLAEH